MRAEAPFTRFIRRVGGRALRSHAAGGRAVARRALGCIAVGWLVALFAPARPSVAASPVPGGAPAAVVLDIKGPIGPATTDYIQRSRDTARKLGATLLILRLDTPGGLDMAMRDIVREILASDIPIVAYVAPSGARAASAGTYILYASHVAAMAPATSIGAATPVRIGGVPSPTPEREKKGKERGEEKEKGEGDDDAPEPRDTLERKTVNDAVAFIRGLAELRERNVDWAERAVRRAATLTARQALESKVIEIVASDVENLVDRLDGRTVKVLGDARKLQTRDLRIVMLEPDWRTQLLGVLTDPNIAYVLMLIGIYGLIYEFVSPGTLFPGVAGGICLLLALFAFQALPINYAGLALIGLGLAFMVAEAFLPSVGALGIGGLIAFVIGSLMLFDTDVPEFTLSWPVVGVVTLATAAGMLALLTLALAGRRRPVVSGREGMVGLPGTVIAADEGTPRVRVQGEVWRARSASPLHPGQTVRMVAMDGLTLVVEPVERDTEGGPS